MSTDLLELDYNEWKRKDAYDFFSAYQNPTMCLTSKVKLANFNDYIKSNNLSFYPAFAHCCLEALSKIPESFNRVIDGKLYYSKSLYAGFTILDKNNNINFTEPIKYESEILKFNSEYKKHRDMILNSPDNYDSKRKNEKHITIYMTCIPWISFTSAINPIKDSYDDNIRLCWGKFYKENNELMIDVSLQVHHGLFDGMQMCIFFKELQNILLEK